MTPDRQAVERAAKAYLAAYDVESSNSEMWYRAVVDARDGLRAALAEATEPATKPEGCPCVCCANRAGMLRAGRTDLRGACYCGMVEDEERCDCAFCLSPTKLVSCSETATPPTPAEGRGEEARIDAIAKVLADANADYVEPRVGVEGKRYGVDLPERFCEMYRYMAARALRSLQHGDGGGKEA